ncbi:cysteine desulfurase [uncultured Roseivirga sp.]|uniref:aminotransferase class V-fold PLP-dependent enzyme n=1 Tax=uncultured Roseivirga sp. TaxID=543088 RepID=UPI0030D7BD51|tara:strand:+ start:51204 stop:52415 length:1212 start_codon:yes stop_codon:yes gene_type:complete
MPSRKSEFPIFETARKEGRPLIFLDNASTTQKPQCVIDAISGFYAGYYANVGRGLYWPATAASSSYDHAREKVRSFIGASSKKEVIFTSGTTDAVNKVVNSFLLPQLEEGDEVLVSEMEHHSNFVPWQQACELKGAQLKVIPLDAELNLDLSKLTSMLTDKVKVLAVTAISNTLGVKNDLKSIINLAHQHNIKVFVDAAQLPLSEKIDVQNMNCDFLAFSGHKVFGPTGIGVLYGKQALLQNISPLAYGGGMVQKVNIDKTIMADLPSKHEAGTPNIAGAIGLAAAINFINSVGVEEIGRHSAELRKYAVKRLSEIEGLTLFAKDAKSTAILSFTMKGIHPHDIAAFLAEKGIAVRAGHHCTHPLMHKLDIGGTVRVSFNIYNSTEEVDLLKNTLDEIKSFFL